LALLLSLAVLGLPGAAHGAAGWQPPLTLSTTGQDAGEPALAIDRRGNALVLWRRSGPGFGIQAALRPAGAGFDPPQTISSRGADPQLGFDARGEAIAVWQGRGGPGGCSICVEASFRPPGGVFGLPQRFPAAGGDLQLAVDLAGNALVLARHPGGFAKQIRYSFRPVGGSFGPRRELSGGLSSSPRVAFGRPGQAVAIWSRGVRIHSAFSRRRGVFGKSRRVGDGDLPSLAVDRSGNAIAIWRSGVFPKARVQVAFRPAGGSFGRPRTLAGPDAGDETDVAFDRRGNALAIWWRRNRNGGNRRVQVAFRPAGRRFGKVRTLSRPASRAAEPKVAFDRHGNALAVWRLSSRQGGGAQVQAAYRPAGRRFGKPRTIARAAEGAADLRLAFGPGGDALAAWEEFEREQPLAPTDSSIRAAAFEP
jgi:hypothetical protein